MEYDCLQGTEMLVLLKKLDEMARYGWRLVSSHCTPVPAGTMHFLMIARNRQHRSQPDQF